MTYNYYQPLETNDENSMNCTIFGSGSSFGKTGKFASPTRSGVHVVLFFGDPPVNSTNRTSGERRDPKRILGAL